ncbi:Putative ferric reductase, NAD binding domain, ferric reductase transmembrane component-like protein [Septoria linicola]|uniref:Ferric reductase, NAD binding domain, ferric reductase transmembrane component-like protein n=1 Tax=Septoria linicola TaxID=215465 RepID=A0A9Q9AWI1_9PEZI|nr:putative ferric reductase, NAD binding domain, ferric reductase transmembrane component-like protein [Septoria linicola]USW53383.1 Putative ferric reductase, NAD binding domain, ferric reductase transmembrane component-like protein [Septoria linicola]
MAWASSLFRRHDGHAEGTEMTMDMDMNMSGMRSGSSVEPLSADGVDFSNSTQASAFLEELLDDTFLKIDGANYAKFFWYGVVAFVAATMLYRLPRWLTLQSRLREAARRKLSPARPKHLPITWLATIAAMGREMSYLQLTPTRHAWFRVPPLGTMILVLAYLVFVLVLEFADNNIEGAQYWQGLGTRAGWLAIAQLPLLILLVNKNSIVGTLTGSSWERLNVLHRWSSRIMLLLAIFHFAFQSTGWQEFGLMQLEWQTDDCPTTGIAAFALLLWMNISTIAPLRSLSYEFFVAQHIITFFGFIVAIVLHLPSTALSSRIYVYIPIGIYLADRSLRYLMLAWNNLRISRAAMVQLEGGVTKLRISNRAIKRWRPGSHVLLSIPKFGFMQSHPATILSTPESHKGDLVFLLKGHRGFTSKIYHGANTSSEALMPESKEDGEIERNAQITNASHVAIIDGPYGGSQSDFAAFDSVLLVAGSTGITFNISLLQDLADRAARQGKKLPVRRVHLVWCVKSTNSAKWVSEEIAAAYDKLRTWGVEVQVSIHVTCADEFTEQGNVIKECGCECDKSKGPCCCVVVDEDEKGEEVGVDKITEVKSSSRVAEKSASSSLLQKEQALRIRMPFLTCATFFSGRPDIEQVITTLLDGANGESAIAVCGPLGLTSTVRNTVVRQSDSRAIHKGTGAQGCYLHVESFS